MSFLPPPSILNLTPYLYKKAKPGSTKIFSALHGYMAAVGQRDEHFKQYHERYLSADRQSIDSQVDRNVSKKQNKYVSIIFALKDCRLKDILSPCSTLNLPRPQSEILQVRARLTKYSQKFISTKKKRSHVGC